MNLEWHTLKCDNSGPNCPQVAKRSDLVYLRSSERPEGVAVFTVAEWDTLKARIASGELP